MLGTQALIEAEQNLRSRKHQPPQCTGAKPVDTPGAVPEPSHGHEGPQPAAPEYPEQPGALLPWDAELRKLQAGVLQD